MHVLPALIAHFFLALNIFPLSNVSIYLLKNMLIISYLLVIINKTVINILMHVLCGFALSTCLGKYQGMQLLLRIFLVFVKSLLISKVALPFCILPDSESEFLLMYTTLPGFGSVSALGFG
jgi:hypothetical protein